MTKKQAESNEVEEEITQTEEPIETPPTPPVKPVKPVIKPAIAPVAEVVENQQDEAPAWFKPFSDTLHRIEEGLKPTTPAPVKPSQPEPQPKGDAQNASQKKGKLKFWRTF